MKIITDAARAPMHKAYDEAAVHKVEALADKVYHCDGYRVADKGDVFDVTPADYEALSYDGSVADA